MRRKVTLFFIHFLIMFLPLATFADEPTSIVFTRYQENYTINENNMVKVVITISTEKLLEEQFVFPLAINNIQNAEVHTVDKNIQVSLITIDNNVYLEINPDPIFIAENNTLTINLKIVDFIMVDGLLFRKKSAIIPLISDYPSNSKNNIFIDSYTANITIPAKYKLDPKDVGKSDSNYNIYLDGSDQLNKDRNLKISAEYLNLHSIKHESIILSERFNQIILLILIFALLVLYLMYFSSLISFKEPVQHAEARY